MGEGGGDASSSVSQQLRQPGKTPDASSRAYCNAVVIDTSSAATMLVVSASPSASRLVYATICDARQPRRGEVSMTGIGFGSVKRARYRVLIIAPYVRSTGALLDNCPSLVINVDVEMPMAKIKRHSVQLRQSFALLVFSPS